MGKHATWPSCPCTAGEESLAHPNVSFYRQRGWNPEVWQFLKVRQCLAERAVELRDLFLNSVLCTQRRLFHVRKIAHSLASLTCIWRAHDVCERHCLRPSQTFRLVNMEMLIQILVCPKSRFLCRALFTKVSSLAWWPIFIRNLSLWSSGRYYCTQEQGGNLQVSLLERCWAPGF